MVRVGLVGIGFMGQQHFGIYQGMENAQVVAVCDKNPDRVAEKAASIGGNIGDATELDLSGLARYVCFEEMLEKEELDCVDVCTPTYLHADMSVQALEGGLSVICEKPMSNNLADCDRMIAAANAGKGMLFIAQCIRFWPEYEVLASMVGNGDLGRIVSAKFTRQSPTPTWASDNWLLNPELSGGAILDLHIHDVDFILSVFGKPSAVLSRACNLVSSGAKVDHVITSYLYDDLVCVAEGGWVMPGTFPFEMGYQVLGDWGLLEFTLAKDPMLRFYPQDGDPYTPDCTPGTGYERELPYFAGCIEKNQAPTRITAESARESVALVMAEASSVASGQPVAVG